VRPPAPDRIIVFACPRARCQPDSARASLLAKGGLPVSSRIAPAIDARTAAKANLLKPLVWMPRADYREAVGYGLTASRSSGSCSTTRRRAPATASSARGTRWSRGAAHEATISAGDKDAGTRGLRPHHRRNYYGAYVRDLDSVEICIVCHRPAKNESEQAPRLAHRGVLSVRLIMNPAPPRRGLRLGTASPVPREGN